MTKAWLSSLKVGDSVHFTDGREVSEETINRIDHRFIRCGAFGSRGKPESTSRSSPDSCNPERHKSNPKDFDWLTPSMNAFSA